MHWSPISRAYVFAHADSGQQLMGVLEKSNAGFRFDYSPGWLDSANRFSADPLNLPLSSAAYTSSRVWGCFDDATPESWGRKVFRAMHKQSPANEIEWLLSARGVGAGCLTFSAARSAALPAVEVPEFSALEQLIELAGDIDQGRPPAGLDDALVNCWLAAHLWAVLGRRLLFNWTDSSGLASYRGERMPSINRWLSSRACPWLRMPASQFPCAS